jgi:anaerobic selenocysteine-containing dehydrogenase
VSATPIQVDEPQTSAATRTVHAVCSLDCPDSCGVLVTVDVASQRAVKIAGDPRHPVTRGFLCGKVARYLDRVYAPDRLLYPMRRRSGVPKGPLAHGREADAFERITWDEALGEIAARLAQIAREHGPESILPYSYAGTIGQLGFGSMDRRFFHRLGASQLDRTICSAAGGAALTSVYGVRLGMAPEDFAHAGLIIAWGANIHGNNIHLWPFIEQARRAGARLIVIDPYRTRTAALADEHLAIRPGTDALLALGLMHVLFRDGLEDRAYLHACTHGADELRSHALLPQHAPDRVAAITSLPAEAIVRLARDYGMAGRNGRRPAAIRMNYGVQRAENGGTAARAIAILPVITGAWQQRGGGLQLSTSGSFAFNTNALQMPELMRASPLGRQSRVVNMSQLGWALTELGRDRGTASPGALEGTPGATAQGGPPIHALFVYNSNAAAVAPNQTAVLAGLRRDDLFTVVHDQFFTDTTDYADIVLPAPTFLEAKDVQGAYGHHFVQITEAAIAPLGEVRSNVRLFGQLGQRMGFPEPCFRDTEDHLIDQALTPTQTTETTASNRKHPSAWMRGITRERLEQEGHVALDMPREADGAVLPFSDASWFQTTSGKAKLLPAPVFIAPRESGISSSSSILADSGTLADADAADAQHTRYPLAFLPRKADNYMNTTFANHAAHQRMERRTAGTLEMHPGDAAARGLTHGDPVEVFNNRGRIALTADLSGRVGQGIVAARLDWNKLSTNGANVNALTSEKLTDLGGGATFYSTMVEVRRSGPLQVHSASSELEPSVKTTPSGEINTKEI